MHFTIICELNGIAYQVDQDLLQPAAITEDEFRQSWINLGNEFETLLLGKP